MYTRECSKEWTTEDALGMPGAKSQHRAHPKPVSLSAVRIARALRECYSGRSGRGSWLSWSERRSFLDREMLVTKLRETHMPCDVQVCDIILQNFGEIHHGRLCIGYRGFVRIITGDYTNDDLEK